MPGVLQRPAVGARTPRKDQRLPTYVAALSLDDPRGSVVADRVLLYYGAKAWRLDTWHWGQALAALSVE